MPVASTEPTTTTSAHNVAEDGRNIWVAAGEGDVERVRYLIEVQGMSPTSADQWTYTPLHAAASYGQVEMLRFLLRHSRAPANAIETTDSDGDTPLFAVEDVRIARLLVEEFHANPKHQNNAGNTAAANAEEDENDEVAAYLRSITGEAPTNPQPSDLEEATAAEVEAMNSELQEGHDDGSANGFSQSAIDATEQRTEALMIRVQQVLQRAEARGASSGEELNEQEEAELRQVVGESVLGQIRQGWGVAMSQQAQQAQMANGSSAAAQNTSSANNASNGTQNDDDAGEGERDGDGDGEAEESQPGR